MPATLYQNPRSPVVLQPYPPVTAASVEQAKREALNELRAAAEQIAADHGHKQMGTWREVGDSEIEASYCKVCWRAAVVEVEREPHLCGPALSERCGPRIVRRPDAFLSRQPNAGRDGVR